jgi:hypothetical protein
MKKDHENMVLFYVYEQSLFELLFLEFNNFPIDFLFFFQIQDANKLIGIILVFPSLNTVV